MAHYITLADPTRIVDGAGLSISKGKPVNNNDETEQQQQK